MVRCLWKTGYGTGTVVVLVVPVCDCCLED
jgi:hypothetical protein